MTSTQYPRLASFKTAEALRRHLTAAGIALEFDETLAPPAASPLATPLTVDGICVGNRFCALPMEGWDATSEGEPSELTARRWRNFGRSGAKLIWGGEAAAVCPEGRANPNQLVLLERTRSAIAALREKLVGAHVERFGARASDDLFVGLQLTHSGRFSRPRANERPEPLAACHHPVLDRRFPAGVGVLTDDDLDRLVVTFIRAARLAYEAGFQFVDVKHCHGYLAHELLGARARDGRYGGSFDNRTRFIRDIVDGILAEVPGLAIGVRLSAFDVVPFGRDASGRGQPAAPSTDYHHAFGLLHDEHLAPALSEACDLLRLLDARGVRWICITAGSPYYCPHVQRPAAFPPIDAYDPPEDPLRGVARHIEATARLKAAFPGMVFVGSAYSYLQEWLVNVAQFNLRRGLTDFVGLGRMMLSYPDFASDVLAGRPLRRKSLCRTFSDCTTGPRTGLVSGCYPLDPFYAAHPHAARLRDAKAAARQ